MFFNQISSLLLLLIYATAGLSSPIQRRAAQGSTEGIPRTQRAQPQGNAENNPVTTPATPSNDIDQRPPNKEGFDAGISAYRTALGAIGLGGLYGYGQLKRRAGMEIGACYEILRLEYLSIKQGLPPKLEQNFRDYCQDPKNRRQVLAQAREETDKANKDYEDAKKADGAKKKGKGKAQAQSPSSTEAGVQPLPPLPTPGEPAGEQPTNPFRLSQPVMKVPSWMPEAAVGAASTVGGLLSVPSLVGRLSRVGGWAGLGAN